MAFYIPDWFTTSNGPFGITLTPGTRAANGTFTAGTLVTLTGHVDDVDIDFSVQHAEISPMSVRGENSVIVKEGATITLVEIVKYASVNLLPAAAYGADYFRIVVTRGLQFWTFYGVRGGLHETLRNEKSTFTLPFHRIETGEVNPVYATTP